MGALLLGDSVRFSLKQREAARLGGAVEAVACRDGFFREALAAELSEQLGGGTAPVLQFAATLRLPDGRRQVNRVQVVGVDARFWSLAPDPQAVEGVQINEVLAEQLGLASGEEVVLRMNRPGWFPAEAPLSPDDDLVQAMRLQVQGVVGPDHFGAFQTRLEPGTPPTIYIPMHRLQEELGIPGRANLILLGERLLQKEGDAPTLIQALRACVQPSDLGLLLRELPALDLTEIRSEQVFISEALQEDIRALLPGASPVLTYLVNDLSHLDRHTPYSFVAAVPPAAWAIPEDEIYINPWLAKDLACRVGDSVTLRYFVLSEGGTLKEEKASFRVGRVLDFDQGWAGDRELMPAFPGINEDGDCRDWDPGYELSIDAIREQDEEYWDTYKGTPKAFLAYSTGRRIWSNRFGRATALRLPSPHGRGENALTGILQKGINPLDHGLRVLPLREQAQAAVSGAMDFGGLFISFSFFVIFAALLLSTMLFGFGLDLRVREMGTLLALGFTPNKVRKLLQREILLLSLLGGLLGLPLGWGFTQLLLQLLAGRWSLITGQTPLLQFHATAPSLLGGLIGALVLGFLVLYIGMHRRLKALPTQLLGAEGASLQSSSQRRSLRRALLLILIGLGGGVAVLRSAVKEGGSAAAMGFFGSAALFLLAALSAVSLLLTLGARSGRSSSSPVKGWGMLQRSLARRHSRSLGVVTLLALGSFMIFATDAHRMDASRDHKDPTSGSGGFAIHLDLTLPVIGDLNDAKLQERLGLDSALLQEARFVPFRVYEGDEASCLSLTRAQLPRLLGVDSKLLEGRFTFAATDGVASADPWQLLKSPQREDALPAVGDYDAILWALGQKVGGTLELDTTGQGDDLLKLHLVGGVVASIFQGSLLLDEAAFVRQFPAVSGYRLFLIDCSSRQREAVIAELLRGLEDYGARARYAEQYLQTFMDVRNMYLSVFQALGVFGVALGTLGLGIVVLRNIRERRRELALLRCVGFSRPRLRRMLLCEHALLLLIGLAVGGACAFPAVGPSLQARGGGFSLTSISLILLALLLNGLLWVCAAAWTGTRSLDLLDGLRSE